MEVPPLSPASGMDVDDGDEYDRMLEDEDEYPDGFWEGVDQLEQWEGSIGERASQALGRLSPSPDR